MEFRWNFSKSAVEVSLGMPIKLRWTSSWNSDEILSGILSRSPPKIPPAVFSEIPQEFLRIFIGISLGLLKEIHPGISKKLLRKIR